MTGLGAYLRSLPGRCASCGHHIELQGHSVTCAASPDEWATFVAAVRAVAVDGIVHQSAMRPRLRGRVAPKSIGRFYRRAKDDGLLVDTGEREPSDDAAGRNTDKLDRIYRLGRAA